MTVKEFYRIKPSVRQWFKDNFGASLPDIDSFRLALLASKCAQGKGDAA